MVEGGMDAISDQQPVVTFAAEYRICVRCVMDTSDPDIEFDDQGRCNHCRRYFDLIERYPPPGPRREKELQRLIERIRIAGRGAEYDCVIGVSGGIDSTTVAYHVKRLGLRPVALHLDNGWNSELAVYNIKRTLDSLDIDLITHVIDWDEFRDIQIAFLRASVPNCEIPTDHAINAYLLRQAMKMKIKYILSGTNHATEGILPFAWTYNALDYKHLKAIHRKFGTLGLQTFPTLSLVRFAWILVVHRIKYVPFLNYIDYRRNESKMLLEQELGWRDYGGKHYESIYTKYYQYYILPAKFGYDKRRAHLSSLICAGEIKREQALSELSRSPHEPEEVAHDRDYVMKKLGLDDAEFRGILSAPPRRHDNYPGHHRLFSPNASPLRNLYRRFVSSG